ncbi:MAG: NAD-dependent epimerase/dehydratase family protein [Candidatus Dormibacteraeota bacterium]|nr:NAD-dependent epimerase/dehydratase family protein [Candidatus Dormibacteraeota bacterium]MBV9525121.1 NAD-dependent epimerase/dehydratase family protein [Candidatus Dormibacteraeota bacterium]
MGEPRRILITGVSRFWGSHLARRLEEDPSVEAIVAVDTRAPLVELKRTDYVRADIRHSLIGKLLHAMDIDTVVHAGLIVDPRRASARVVHETNVIGTMNLIAACSAADSPVRKLVVKSSTAIYGSEPDDPSFWAEDMARKAPPRDTFTRDLDEVEAYVRDFRLRRPNAVVTLLRFANVLGPTHDTPFVRLFDLPVVPTIAGFDPRLQFLDEEDAVRVLERVVLEDHSGTFNVAGPGIVLLSQAVQTMGKVNLPVIPFIGSSLAMLALERIAPVGFSPHLLRLLQYGRVVDTGALCARLGDVVQHSSAETVQAHARNRRVRDIVRAEPAYQYEAELEEFLRARRPAGNGHAPAAMPAPTRPVRRRRKPRRAPAQS